MKIFRKINDTIFLNESFTDVSFAFASFGNPTE